MSEVTTRPATRATKAPARFKETLTRMVEDATEYQGACQLTRTQLITVCETAAGDLYTLNTLLIQAQAEEDPLLLAGLINAAQALTRHIGGMVDAAAGEAILGGHDSWNFGPNYAHSSKAGAA